MTLKKREEKQRINKLDMKSDKDFGSGRIKAKICALSERVPYEDTWFRVRVKFVSEVGTKLGVAKTTKDTKFRVVRRSAKDFLKRRSD